ncbi:hypothetical protein IW261DRAFT_1626825 [Armillaria novae-zelandiae]|uniref:Uncharacterized protein n=1 Tax=Armillaria novae-zelandiae TaxID=153914 RepID=A0AA39UEJ2_9AGAR|nr:hypothetical protein IW261DRAFT_1626825 [Armillaria novae-zelandiae]
MSKIERSAEEGERLSTGNSIVVPIARYPDAFRDLVPALWTLKATSNVQEFGRKIFLKEHVKCTADVYFMSVFEDDNNGPLRMNVTAFSTYRGTILPTRVHNQMEFRPEYLYKLENVARRDRISASLAVHLSAVFPFLFQASIRPGFYKSWSLKFDQMETFRIRRGQGLTILGYSRGRLDSRHVHARGWRHVDQNNMQTVEKFSADVTSISNFKIKRLRTYFRTVRRLSKFRRVCRICAKSLFPTDTTTALGVPDRGTLNGRVIPSSMSEHAMSVYIRRDTPLIFFGRVFLNEFGDQSRSMVKRNGQYLSEIEVWKTG